MQTELLTTVQVELRMLRTVVTMLVAHECASDPDRLERARDEAGRMMSESLSREDQRATLNQSLAALDPFMAQVRECVGPVWMDGCV